MYYPFSWFKNIAKLAALLLLVLMIGAYFDNTLLAWAGFMTALVVTNYWRLFQLNRWLWYSKKMTPPHAKGVLGNIYDGIYYSQRRARNKRKQLGLLIRRFREGSEALPDAVVVVDDQGHIFWCNRLARLELGLKWPEDSGRRLDNLIRHPKFVAFFNAGNFERPVEIPSPTNVDKTFEYRVMPYGENHYLFIARDVTQISQLEQMRKDFVANVSHELRTPLTVLTGYLEMFKGQVDMPPALLSKAHSEMASQATRMQNLVEELLTLSRIEASSERVYEKTVDVPKLLKAIETETLSLNKTKQHTIRFNIDNNLLVLGVETELRSAFSNLIFNAINYTPNGGEIVVDWHNLPDGARFSVRDNGDGIAPEHLNRLTERFYRVDKARSRKTGGSGLGLSIVKHVLSHHNSKLDIASRVSEGSEFSFVFKADMTVNRD
ncbi:phosphate regulon sensor histidine kinase PhoR [Alteromonas sp. a30]|uniref:phosphate regulon sensor histidine kinase PhoR n=1 Tax=Alteromonas sp. a30 TaxID=2730917 RepID=UPI00227FA88F|nr:phosphate regulon sensor histidine kinase PhoR [Alteromonas sp. a30]MCY7296046.1 phosphate regulon sensor histidine kinase PhoR [Alteromonas sp. a30]